MPVEVNTYTYPQFTAAVNALLPIDASRLGSVASLMGLWQRQAIIEIQSLIPFFRQNHEYLFLPGDFVLEGYASRAAMPPQARVRQAWLVRYGNCGTGLAGNIIPNNLTYGNPPNYVVTVQMGITYYYTPGANEASLLNGSQTLTLPAQFTAQGPSVTLTGISVGQAITASIQLSNFNNAYPQLDSITNITKSIQTCERYPLLDLAWERRFEAINGNLPTNGGRGYICFDPQGETFYTFPGIKDCENVSLFFDGKKINFQPNELTPFTEQMTLVVADYVESRVRTMVDKDLPYSQACLDKYVTGRSLLALDSKEQRQTNPQNR